MVAHRFILSFLSVVFVVPAIALVALAVTLVVVFWLSSPQGICFR